MTLRVKFGIRVIDAFDPEGRVAGWTPNLPDAILAASLLWKETKSARNPRASVLVSDSLGRTHWKNGEIVIPI